MEHYASIDNFFIKPNTPHVSPFLQQRYLNINDILKEPAQVSNFFFQWNKWFFLLLRWYFGIMVVISSFAVFYLFERPVRRMIICGNQAKNNMWKSGWKKGFVDCFGWSYRVPMCVRIHLSFKATFNKLINYH